MPPEVNPAPAPVTIEGIAGLIGQVDAKILAGEQKFVALQKDLDDKTKTLNEYIINVEKDAAKARTSSIGTGVTDNLKSAIPDRHRKGIDLHMRTGAKYERAIELAAMEAWLKASLQLNNPAMARNTGALLDEMDALEKAFGMGSLTKANLAEGAAGTGGNLVPTILEAEVLRQIQDSGVARGLCRIVPMSVVTHAIPNLATNTSAAIIAEAGSITQAEPTFGQVNLTAKMIGSRAVASLQLLQDSSIGLITFLTQIMAEQYALLEDAQVFEGDGTGSNFTGVVAAAGTGAVTNLANGSVPTYAKVLEQKWKGRKRSTRKGAAWVTSPEVAAKLEGVVDSQLQPIFKDDATMLSRFPGQGNGSMPDGMLKGFPLYTSDQIAITRAVGASGSVCSNMYFGPWGHGVIIGDLLGLTFGVSEHAQWATGQIDLRMIKRTAVLIGVPADMTKQTGLITT